MEVSLIVALIAFIASMISLYVGIIQNRKTRFINTITSERIKWMEKLRSQISSYCSLCWHYSVSYHRSGKETSIKIQAEIDKTGTLIRLLLNPSEPAAVVIIDRIKQMRRLIFKTDIGELLHEIEDLTVDSQNLLKQTWDENKEEARTGNLKHDMANVRKGLNRIVWFISIGSALAVWTYLFSSIEIRTGVPEGGYSFIKKLDRNPALADSVNWRRVLEDMPNLDIELFKLRYNLTSDSGVAVDKKEVATNLPPAGLFRREIQLNILMLVFAKGLITFIGVWLIWFAIRWVILGFKS